MKGGGKGGGKKRERRESIEHVRFSLLFQLHDHVDQRERGGGRKEWEKDDINRALFPSSGSGGEEGE